MGHAGCHWYSNRDVEANSLKSDFVCEKILNCDIKLACPLSVMDMQYSQGKSCNRSTKQFALNPFSIDFGSTKTEIIGGMSMFVCCSR